MCCDGSFLYVHDIHGLRAIGTGYHNTIRDRIYAKHSKYRSEEKLW